MRNMTNPTYRNVGHTADGIGVVNEVKSECEEHPSELLSIAIVTIYVRFQQQA